MKKIIYMSITSLMLTSMFVACEEEEGTAPGNDSEPIVTVYSFVPESPYNSDNDLKVRVAANNKASEIYYLAELTSDVEAYITANGSSAYYEKVISEGTKVNVAPAEIGDVYVTDMFGQNTITFVAANGNAKNAATISFFGYTWNTISKGTYTYSEKAQSRLGIKSASTELQVNADDATSYRFKNLWGAGNHMYLSTTEYTGEDEDGAYTFIRVPSQKTPYEFGDHGTISVRDIAAWKGDDSYVTSSFGAVLYNDGSYASIVVQYFVSDGNLDYGADEYVAE